MEPFESAEREVSITNMFLLSYSELASIKSYMVPATTPVAYKNALIHRDNTALSYSANAESAFATGRESDSQVIVCHETQRHLE